MADLFSSNECVTTVTCVFAVGLLFGFDAQPEVGHDGKPRRNHVVQHFKHYQRMLKTLVNEVFDLRTYISVG